MQINLITTLPPRTPPQCAGEGHSTGLLQVLGMEMLLWALGAAQGGGDVSWEGLGAVATLLAEQTHGDVRAHTCACTRV